MDVYSTSPFSKAQGSRLIMDTEQERKAIAVEDYNKIVLFRHSREVAYMDS